MWLESVFLYFRFQPVIDCQPGPSIGLTDKLILDPFADERDPLADSADVGSTADNIHIRIQQRNGRKTLTTLQGLPKRESLSPLTSIFFKSKYISFNEQNMIRRKS